MIGSASDSTYFLTGQALAMDIFNFANNKQLNQYVRPLALTIAFSYTTPKLEASGAAMKVLSHAVRDWQTGVVVRLQSGALMGNPTSLNQLTTSLQGYPELRSGRYHLLEFDREAPFYDPRSQLQMLQSAD